MGTILEEICNRKRHYLVSQKERIKPTDLYKEVESMMDTATHHSLEHALRQSKWGIIAEYKRKSPSVGWIKKFSGPEDVVPFYEEKGATAISILTDEPYFGGRMEYIEQMRPKVNIPILRKDFMVDEYQVFEAKKIGADAILLIAACLTKEECKNMALLAQNLQLDVLLEVHEEKELEYICPGVTVVGVNNRDLHTFITNVQTSLMLANKIPNEYAKISESGLKHYMDIQMLKIAGYNGFLMGEHFMKKDNPGNALAELLEKLG